MAGGRGGKAGHLLYSKILKKKIAPAFVSEEGGAQKEGRGPLIEGRRGKISLLTGGSLLVRKRVWETLL